MRTNGNQWSPPTLILAIWISLGIAILAERTGFVPFAQLFSHAGLALIVVHGLSPWWLLFVGGAFLVVAGRSAAAASNVFTSPPGYTGSPFGLANSFTGFLAIGGFWIRVGVDVFRWIF